MCLFANDTSLSLALENPDLRADILNRDLERISDWADRWKVKFNTGKTDVVNFYRGQHTSHQLLFGNTNLEETTHHKHLGLILQTDGKWTEHLRYTSFQS